MRRSTLAALASLALVACGGKAPAPTERAWNDARVEGIAEASGVTVHGDVLLIVAGGDDRRLHVVARSDLRPGATVRATSLPLEVREAARVVGSDELAAKDYTAGDLWGQPVDFQGVATHEPDVLYVADRAYRVVYSGTLASGAAGRPSAARLARVFAVPGADRQGKARSDWRDAGPGLAGIVAMAGRKGEDVYVVDRRDTRANETRIWRMDRYGQAAKWFRAALPEGTEADVGDLAADEETGDLVLVRGGGAGTLPTLREAGWTRTVTVAAGAAGPAPPTGAAWRGLARAADGTTYLVSSGAEVHVAWR